MSQTPRTPQDEPLIWLPDIGWAELVSVDPEANAGPQTASCVVKKAKKRDLPGDYAEWRATPDGERVYGEVLLRVAMLRGQGHRHFGIGAIWESIRYDFSVKLGGDESFRLNNNHRAFMAREIMAADPRLEGFFELREAAADE